MIEISNAQQSKLLAEIDQNYWETAFNNLFITIYNRACTIRFLRFNFTRFKKIQ